MEVDEQTILCLVSRTGQDKGLVFRSHRNPLGLWFLVTDGN